MSIAVVATCYGDYWERFSERWLASIEALDPRPAQVILVTDVLRPLAGIDNIVIGSRHMSDYWNVGVKYASAEWVALSGFDDEWLPDAMEPFDTDAGVYSYPTILAGEREGVWRYGGGYDAITTDGDNPMVGGYFHRREVLERFPLRRLAYSDWAQFCELSRAGVRIEFSNRPRHIFHRHPSAFSLTGDSDHLAEIATFKARLNAGLIEEGAPE